jgi:hypothetical protein
MAAAQSLVQGFGGENSQRSAQLSIDEGKEPMEVTCGRYHAFLLAFDRWKLPLVIFFWFQLNKNDIIMMILVEKNYG